MRQFDNGSLKSKYLVMTKEMNGFEEKKLNKQNKNKGGKKGRKCFIVNREAYDRINYLYQVFYIASYSLDPIDRFFSPMLPNTYHTKNTGPNVLYLSPINFKLG